MNSDDDSVDLKATKQSLIKMLEALSKTMSVTPLPTLLMDTYYWNAEELYMVYHKETAFNGCGYAACIVGDQALKLDFDVFPPTQHIQGTVDASNLTAGQVRLYADDITYSLDRACHKLYGSCDLAESIYTSIADTRMYAAIASGVFCKDELEDLRNCPHLTEKYPTPEQAKNYIDLVLSKVKAYPVQE